MSFCDRIIADMYIFSILSAVSVPLMSTTCFNNFFAVREILLLRMKRIFPVFLNICLKSSCLETLKAVLNSGTIVIAFFKNMQIRVYSALSLFHKALRSFFQ